MSTNTGAQTCIYDVSVLFTLENTDREVANEFATARDVTAHDAATIEVVQSVVAPDIPAAYHRGVALVRAILGAAGLPDQYSIEDVSVEDAR